MKLNGERGASAVEFALVASLLFMVVFGIIQFGIAYNRVQGMHAGAREGARLGALVDTTVLQVRDRVKQSVSIVNSANLANTCPGSLSVEQGCIQVYRSTNNTAACPPTGSTCTLMGADTDKPCAGATAERVIVRVRYRMQVTVAFVASFTPTVSGVGDFVCENGG